MSSGATFVNSMSFIQWVIAELRSSIPLVALLPNGGADIDLAGPNVGLQRSGVFVQLNSYPITDTYASQLSWLLRCTYKDENRNVALSQCGQLARIVAGLFHYETGQARPFSILPQDYNLLVKSSRISSFPPPSLEGNGASVIVGIETVVSQTVVSLTSPVPVLAVYAEGPQLLSVVFDQPISSGSTVVPSQLRLTGNLGTYDGYEDIVKIGNTIRVQFALPGNLGEPYACAYVSGAGQILGTNGLAAATFSGFATSTG